ncbi:MAG: hypothetical protein HKN21_04715 [Candidatus Eisenbacteria bacterium]|uniref:Uncharacterized protein n=1 Tax=Eiseniibacteriota bacterium TaxID=2212470 RepID=A0A7Y2E7E1_UNCEI|nr:hypothetical protein [Candidatus Eisenbacteria bacterium]
MRLLAIRNLLLRGVGSFRFSIESVLSAFKILALGVAVGFCLWARSEIADLLVLLWESLQEFFPLAKETVQSLFQNPDPLTLSLFVGIPALFILLIVLWRLRAGKNNSVPLDPEPVESPMVDLSDLSIPALARKTGMAQDILRSLRDQDTPLFPRRGENGIFFRSS